MARPHLPTAAAGFLGVALNVLAVVALQPISHTYRPGDVPAWLAETIAHPGATTLSAWAFTVGLVALAAFCAGLAWAVKTPGVVVGASFFGLGALLDAAGTMGPLAALHVDHATGLGLLWMALLVDSAFNGLLGVGLVLIAVGLPAGWSRGNRGLAAVATSGLKADVGLGLVDNTADAAKPVSAAQAAVFLSQAAGAGLTRGAALGLDGKVPIAQLPPCRPDGLLGLKERAKFSRPAREFVHRVAQDLMGQKIGPAVVGRGGINILDALVALPRPLELVQKSQHLNQVQETVVVAAAAQPLVRKRKQLHIRYDHRNRF